MISAALLFSRGFRFQRPVQQPTHSFRARYEPMLKPEIVEAFERALFEPQVGPPVKAIRSAP